MTIKQYISNITNDLRALNLDDWISPKFIYYKAINIVSDFMKKDNSANRRLSKMSEGWMVINCFPMEEIPLIDCCEVDVYTCEKLMKSKYALPITFTSSFGNIIEYVSSPNLGAFYDPTSPRSWKAIQKRKDKDKRKKYYFIIDNYLYIPIPKGETEAPELVNIKAWFTEPWKVKELINIIECKVPNCVNLYEMNMPIPEYLYNDVSKEMFNQLRSIYLQVVPDDYPNLNSSDKTNQRDLNNGK